MITAVFFDLYNTLARFDPPPEYLQKEACHNLGIDADLDLLREGYVTADRFMAEQNATRPINTLTRDERRSFFGQYEQIILRASGIQMTTDEALDVLAAVVPKIKRCIVKACVACVVYDQYITVSEAELLRAVADSLGCPIPPIIANDSSL